MKKSRSMRLASALLVLTLLSTCMISGTFAKYTTQDSGSDSARVAKWGVELQVAGNLYGDSYKDLIVAETANDVTVQSVDTAADVVAPGTKNEEGFTFSLKGQPEVDGVVTTTMKIQEVFLAANKYGVMIPVDEGVVTAANFDEFTNLYYGDNGVYKRAESYSNVQYFTLEDDVDVYNNYYPVVYNLDGTTSLTGQTYGVTSLKNAADAIAAKLGLTTKEETKANDTSTTYTCTAKFDSNTDLASLGVDGLKLTWAWAFGDEDKVGDNADWTDKADTILGLLDHGETDNTVEGTVVKLSEEQYVPVVEYTDYCLDTQFSIDITVTQVD